MTGADAHLEFATAGGERFAAEEGEDSVTAQEQATPRQTVLVCANPALRAAGIELRKRFRLSADGSGVTAEYELRNGGDRTYLVEGWLHVRVAADFRAGCHYYVPFPQCVPWLDANSVTEPRVLYSAVYAPLHTAACALVDPGRNLGVASYLAGVNGKYTNWVFASPFREEAELFRPPISGYNPIATPDGWEHYCHRDFLDPGGRTSFAVRYVVFRGDSGVFLRHALNDPERVALHPGGKPPEWMQDAMLMMFVTQADRMTPENAARWAKAAEALGGDGCLLPVFDRYGHIGGDYATQDAGAEALREVVRAARAACPRVRVGAYVIGALDERTEAYRLHPEWVVRDASGSAPLLDFPGRFIPQLGVPEVAGYYREQWTKVVRDLDLDYLYVDGGDGAAFGAPDWGHRKVTHYGDVYALARGLSRDLHGLAPPRGLFMNTPTSVVADGMFQEMGGGQWSDEGDWRGRSDALVTARLNAEFRRGTWASPLYPYNLRKYFSQLLALALRPNHGISSDTDLEEVTGRWRPYIRAAYALRECRLVEADLRPNWRREPTSVEAYLLRDGNVLRVMLISHAKESRPEAVSFDLGSAGMAKARAPWVTAWDMVDPEEREVPENAFAALGPVPAWVLRGRVRFEVKLRPELLTMVVVGKRVRHDF